MNTIKGSFRLCQSSIGRKVYVAISGSLLIGFLVAHVAGNWVLFQGRETFNTYTAFLQKHALLWPFRVILVGLFASHIFLASQLVVENSVAKGQRYAVTANRKASLTSRTMMISGLLLLVFLIYHILNLTVGVWNSTNFDVVDEQGRKDAYSLVLQTFQQPLHVLLYLGGMLVLLFHLLHGTSSAFQTLGLTTTREHSGWRMIGWLVVAFVVIGFCAVPLAVYLGWVG